MPAKRRPRERGSRTWPRRSPRSASARRAARKCWWYLTGPARVRSRSLTPTAVRWRRIPRVAVGYNAQVAVDAKHKLIVEQQVTNQVADIGLLTQTAEPAKAALGVETIAVVADRGHFKIEDIEACEKAGD